MAHNGSRTDSSVGVYDLAQCRINSLGKKADSLLQVLISPVRPMLFCYVRYWLNLTKLFAFFLPRGTVFFKSFSATILSG